MVETLSELLENAANVAEDNGGKLSIASAAVLIAEAYELGMDKIHPITGEPPLHVHHIDGDATNNSEDNLQLLCPNCHSFYR